MAGQRPAKVHITVQAAVTTKTTTVTANSMLLALTTTINMVNIAVIIENFTPDQLHL